MAGGGNPNVEYISNLSAPRPTVRIGDPKKENRLRFLHRSGELRQADRRLAAKAGVKTDGRVVFQFYDQGTYGQLLDAGKRQDGQAPHQGSAADRLWRPGARPAGTSSLSSTSNTSAAPKPDDAACCVLAHDCK